MRSIVSLVSTAALCAAAAAASTVSDPTYFGQVRSDGAGTTFHVLTSDSLTYASFSMSGAPAASVTADASGGTNNHSGSASAAITYFMEYSGPSNVTIPLLMTVAGEVDTTGGAGNLTYAAARIEFDSNQLWEPFCRADFGCSKETIGQTFSFNIQSNQEYQVLISAGANVSTGNTDGTAHAFADPQFSIDPSFANAGDYSLVLSSGIGNALTAAPEPATITAAGLALAALIARRRAVRNR